MDKTLARKNMDNIKHMLKLSEIDILEEDNNELIVDGSIKKVAEALSDVNGFMLSPMRDKKCMIEVYAITRAPINDIFSDLKDFDFYIDTTTLSRAIFSKVYVLLDWHGNKVAVSMLDEVGRITLLAASGYKDTHYRIMFAFHKDVVFILPIHQEEEIERFQEYNPQKQDYKQFFIKVEFKAPPYRPLQ